MMLKIDYKICGLYGERVNTVLCLDKKELEQYLIFIRKDARYTLIEVR